MLLQITRLFIFLGWLVLHGVREPHFLFLSLSVLHWTPDLVVVGNAAVNAQVLTFLGRTEYKSFAFMPTGGSSGQAVILFGCADYIPVSSLQGFPFLHIRLQCCLSLVS